MSTMSAAFQDNSIQRMAVSEFNSQAMNLKEEIRAIFLQHKKSLASRELWLLDQVDNLKETTMALMMKKQISMAEVKGRMGECTNFMSFSKEHDYLEGVDRASDVMAQLQKKVQEYAHSNDTRFPSIKFMHNDIQLRNSILSYGRLQTKSCSDADETDSFLTEKSWDLVDERLENEEDDNEEAAVKGRCCGTMATCCQSSYEIEDMDFSTILNSDTICQEQVPVGSDFDRSDLLKKFCKANEICCSISECVCDTPCIKISQMNASMDPVGELHDKLEAVYAEGQGGFQDYNNKGGSTKPETEDRLGDDPLIQITNAVNGILGSMCDQSSKSKKTTSLVEETDIIGDLNSKLQRIIDGNEDGKLSVIGTNFCKYTEAVSADNKSSYFDSSLDGSEKKDSGSADEVFKLHKKLAHIYQGDVLAGPIFESHDGVFFGTDPVNLLSNQLQRLLTC
ncbi:uncharacterized protein LOC120342397 [Styela clava]